MWTAAVGGCIYKAVVREVVGVIEGGVEWLWTSKNKSQVKIWSILLFKSRWLPQTDTDGVSESEVFPEAGPNLGLREGPRPRHLVGGGRDNFRKPVYLDGKGKDKS